MAIQRQAPEFRPWVEQVAGLIGDPIRRLRFLRAVTPLMQPAKGGPSRRRSRPFVIPLLLFTAAGAAILWLARVTIRF
jgi:hypothetical protein